MIELRQEIPAELSQPLEDWFCGLTRSPWMLYHEGPGHPHYVMGYFETAAEADAAWGELRRAFKRLPETCGRSELADRDWKEAYKEHLRPWNHGRIHWVPSWLRGKHAVPADAAVIWFDAGLAFGTGDHPTTRLCAIRLMDHLEAHPAARVKVTDAGCGSGILALSAAQLGCGEVLGFDRDPEAVRVSLDNRRENGLAESFSDADRNPPVYDPATQQVTMPESFAKSFRAYRDSGFWNIEVPAELGGTVAPPSFRWAIVR